MEENKNVSKEDMLKRLKRIEGQVRGIYKMIDEERHCADILTQVAAVRAAMNKVGSLILEKNSIQCIQQAISSDNKEKAFNELAKNIQSFLR